MIDTHTHVNFKVFENDWRVVVDRAVAAGVERMVVVGTDVASSKKAVAMAQEHEALYASVGVHPHHARGYLEIADSRLQVTGDEWEKILKRMQNDVDAIRSLAQDERVVAIGELGLDYHYYKNSKRYEITKSEEENGLLIMIQKELLRQQVQLAGEFRLPVILHSREAGDEVLKILKQVQDDITISGVFHCFDGSKGYLQRVLEAGFYVSLTGNITYAQDRAQVSTEIPLERLLLETDAPFMTPTPLRGERNEPRNVSYVAAKHAQLRDVSVDEIEKETDANARALFGV